MGDRGNILVLQHPGNDKSVEGIFIYSHWGAKDLPGALQKALQKKERWSDESYLTRIIVYAVIGADGDNTMGYGISTYLTDNQHPILVVDCSKQTVSVVPGDAIRADDGFAPVLRSTTFLEYCELSAKELLRFRDGKPAEKAKKAKA